MLCIDFRGYQSTYRFTLPPPGVGAAVRALRLAVPVPAEGHGAESRRSLPVGRGDGRPAAAACCARSSPTRRAVPVPAPSTLFTGRCAPASSGPTGAILPRPQVSSDDPSAGYLATITATDPRQLIAQLRAAPRAHRRGGPAARRGDDRRRRSSTAPRRCSPRSRRATRGNGESAGTAGSPTLARRPRRRGRARASTRVYRAVPGELAPKLALGLACEIGGEPG